jgi:hypothetical protein
MPNAILLIFIKVNVVLSNDILIKLIMLIAILLNLILLNFVMLIAIMLNQFLLNVILQILNDILFNTILKHFTLPNAILEKFVIIFNAVTPQTSHWQPQMLVSTMSHYLVKFQTSCCVR